MEMETRVMQRTPLKQETTPPKNTAANQSTTPKPWIVMAVFPGHNPKPIAQTCYKSDAESHVRFLKRYMTQGKFYVVCEESSTGKI
jgi:hypothetical protein